MSMGGRGGSKVGGSGTIKTADINEAHRQIHRIVESYRTVNNEVHTITKEVLNHWEGESKNDFQNQYNLLIKKIDDFGDTLLEIYEALVEAEAQYETADDSLRKEFVQAVQA